MMIGILRVGSSYRLCLDLYAIQWFSLFRDLLLFYQPELCATAPP